MVGVIKKKTRVLLWILVGVVFGTTLAEAAEHWQNEPYGPYHSQYRYTQGGRYPENPQGEYAGAYPENRAWEYGEYQGRYPENRGYASYPPEGAPREYARDPRGYPEPQRDYGRGGYGNAPRDPRSGYSEPPQLQRRDVRGGSWYPPESVREPAYDPRGGYTRGYPPETTPAPREYGRNDPRGRYPEPSREYGRREYPAPRDYGRSRGGYPENPGYTRGGGEYPSARGSREYSRDPRGGYVPAAPPREYARGGYPEPRGYQGYHEGWGSPQSGYFNMSDEYFQGRYENILQEYLGRRYSKPGSPAAPYYYPYRY